MPIPQNKENLLLAIKSAYRQLKEELTDIPAELTIQKTLPGHAQHTIMSVCDLLAYLIGWASLVLKWYKKKQQNKTVIFPEDGYKWNQLGDLAQKFYVDYENLSYVQLIAHLDAKVEQIIAIVEKQNNAQLYETLWYNKHTMGRMIQLNTSSAFKNARIRIRKWKKLTQ